MIKVHNFYNDLLLYMRHLFEDIIFGPNIIKHYEFNVGNRSLQLDYNTQFEFPMVLFNLQDIRVVNHHPWLILRSGLNNQSNFPVLYNKNKNLTLELQEEEHEIVIGCNINCESQYSAIQMNHRIVSNLPINKPLDLSHFYTFLEIPEEFLDTNFFEVNYDDIVNLYSKFNPMTNLMEYCYSVKYEPLVRLDSCTIGLSNSEPRSFPVECVFTIHTSIPMYVQIPFDEYPTQRLNEIIIEKNVTISLIDALPLLDILIKNKNTNKLSYVKLPLFLDNNKFTSKYDDNDISIDCNGLLLNEQIFGNIIFDVYHDELICSFHLIKNYETSIISVVISGPINGTITNFKMEDDHFCGFLFATYHGKYINKSISGKIDISKKSWVIQDININICSDYQYLSYKILDFGNISNSSNTSINFKKVQYIPNKCKVVSIELYENNTNKIHNISTDIQLDKYGSFIVSFDHIHSITLNKIQGLIHGKLHPKTFELTTDIIEEQSGYDFKIFGITFDLQFENIPKYGSKVIEKINFDISSELSPIAVNNNLQFFKDAIDTFKHQIRCVILNNTPRFGFDRSFTSTQTSFDHRMSFNVFIRLNVLAHFFQYSIWVWQYCT